MSYAELVEFNFRMHLPTEVDRQGPDRGTQYRTAIFTTDDDQAEIAKKIRAEVQEAHYPNDKIATTVSRPPTPLARARALGSHYSRDQRHTCDGTDRVPCHFRLSLPVSGTLLRITTRSTWT